MLTDKDTAVLSLLCNLNEFDEAESLGLAWYVPYHPISYKTLADYPKKREAPKHRQHIQQLLEYYGV